MILVRPKALFLATAVYGMLVMLVVGGKSAQAQSETLESEACFVSGISRPVECYDLEVPENWDAPDGKKISLHMVIIPATGAIAKLDPLIIFAGGPGQAATDYSGFVPVAFKAVNQTRDVILLDQRGTGSSTPLECDFGLATVAGVSEADITSQIKTCLQSYQADIRYFTSFDIIRDIEYVRESLGIEKLNIWGGSYGTRLGLLYMKLHPDSIRSAILDGVAAPNSRLFVDAPRSAEEAFQSMLASCFENGSCRQAYPDTEKTLLGLLQQYTAQPEVVKVSDVFSGGETDVLITGPWIAESVRTSLYIPTRASLLPYAIDQAGRGNFSPLVAASLDGAFWAGQTMAVGSTLAILCSEEVPRTPMVDLAEAAKDTFHGDNYYRFWALACQDVPIRDVLSGYEDPITADIPTLVLSGALDPVTPPFSGEAAYQHLGNAWHFVAANAGHNVTPFGCAPGLLAKFIEQAGADGLDASCLNDPPRPPFLINPLTLGLSTDSIGAQ